MHFLYKITNFVNNKVYIGQTTNIASRWASYRSDIKNVNPTQVITRAIKKYGLNNFRFEIIACTKCAKNANLLEIELIAQYQSHISTNKGYNVSMGGNVSSKKGKPGKKLTEEQKQHLRDVHTGKKHRPESIEKMRNKVFTETHKANISKSLTGKILTDEHRKNIGLAQKGRKQSPESNEKRRLKQLGKPRSQKSIEKTMKIKPDQFDLVLNDYQKIKSSRKVAEKYGVSKGVILKILNIKKAETSKN